MTGSKPRPPKPRSKVALAKVALANVALVNPGAAAYLLARYRRLMRLLILALLGTVIATVTLILKHRSAGSDRLGIAMALAIAFAMLLASALLGRALLARRAAPANEDAAE